MALALLRQAKEIKSFWYNRYEHKAKCSPTMTHNKSQCPTDAEVITIAKNVDPVNTDPFMHHLKKVKIIYVKCEQSRCAILIKYFNDKQKK